MKVFGLAGWSGSGKTTLVAQLIPALLVRGISVSTIKHAHHAFDVDQPGKDSYTHRKAGATEVLVTSQHRWALMHENRGAPEPTLDELLLHLSPVDLVLVEGFKALPHDKLEIYRKSIGKPLLCTGDRHIVAVASDGPVPDAPVPVVDLGDVVSVTEFILSHCGLNAVETATGMSRRAG